MLVGKKTNNIGEQGIIYVPYILTEHTDKSLNSYNDFKDNYNRQRLNCPVCGHTTYTSTLMGYTLNWDDKDNYMDLNRCVCTNCGDNHTFHERINITGNRKRKINKIKRLIKNNKIL
jgi:hypothetical protein